MDLARLALRGSILPSGLELWAARRGFRGREAELLGPLAERLCCHPPNFSTRRARREREPGGRGAGGGGSRAARQRACAPRAGAAPRPARPEVQPGSGAPPRESPPRPAPAPGAEGPGRRAELDAPEAGTLPR